MHRTKSKQTKTIGRYISTGKSGKFLLEQTLFKKMKNGLKDINKETSEKYSINIVVNVFTNRIVKEQKMKSAMSFNILLGI